MVYHGFLDARHGMYVFFLCVNGLKWWTYFGIGGVRVTDTPLFEKSGKKSYSSPDKE